MASDKLDVIIFGASGFSKWQIDDFSFGYIWFVEHTIIQIFIRNSR